jgi:hypothetical protein
MATAVPGATPEHCPRHPVSYWSTPQHRRRTRAHPAVRTRPRPVAERGAYSQVSFAIEPIQLPIVPLSLFSLQDLHTTASA